MNFIFQNVDDQTIIELEADDIDKAWTELDHVTAGNSDFYVARDELPVLTIIGSTQVSDETGESYDVYTIAKTRRHADPNTIGEAVKAYFPSYRCEHEYDCCGRFYPSGATWSTTQFGDTILIRQSFYCNI